MENNKLKKLNIKGKEFLKKTQPIASAAFGAAVGMTVGLMGGDMETAMLIGGVAGARPAVATTFDHIDMTMATAPSKRQKIAAFAAGLAATVFSAGLGMGAGAGTHKLTTAIIDKVIPDHQIEQTVEVEPMPVVDEIQVEK